MLTQKAITSVLPKSNELNKNVVRWVVQNATLLQESFSKKYPRSKNKFNVQLQNVEGRNRTIVRTRTGDIKLDKTSSYKNVLTWQNVRSMGCPAE